jgi:trigger factor
MDVMKVVMMTFTLAVDVDFTIESTQLNWLNWPRVVWQTFGEGAVASLDELKAKIKEDAETQFATQADQKLLEMLLNF